LSSVCSNFGTACTPVDSMWHMVETTARDGQCTSNTYANCIGGTTFLRENDFCLGDCSGGGGGTTTPYGTTTPVIYYQDWLQVNLWIIFLLALQTFGLFFNYFFKKKS